MSASRVTLRVGDRIHTVEVRRTDGGAAVIIDGRNFPVTELDLAEGEIRFAGSEGRVRADVVVDGGKVHVAVGGRHWVFVAGSDGDPRSGSGPPAEGEIRSPMTGRVVALLVEQGTRVSDGAEILVVEAMKMEHRVRARAPGRVSALHVKAGDLVELGALLAVVAPEGEAP